MGRFFRRWGWRSRGGVWWEVGGDGVMRADGVMWVMGRGDAVGGDES